MMMAEANWSSIYRLGAVAALLAVLFAVLEILITLLPGGERVAPELLTVPLWFARLQANPLLELRNLGLVNIFLTTFGLLLSFALFAAHRTVNPGWAGLALVIAAIGGRCFLPPTAVLPCWRSATATPRPATKPSAPPWSPQAKPCWRPRRAIPPAPSWPLP
ncbi:MAG: hypothetical protein EOM24_20085 [Chloroflexia bacterium]|nr:hypothetical protein [Chloroflexia bacterium]